MVEHLVPTDQLKTNRLAEASQKHLPFFVDYDKRFDALYIRIVPRGIQTVVHYIDEYVGLLYEPDSFEIIGLQVENFEYSFLPNHESVQRVWKLSASGIKLENVGDMILEIERRTPKVAREVIKVTKDVLGTTGVELEKVVA